MENMKEELYKELHITKEDDKAIISGLICNYSAYRSHDYNELKALVKAEYKQIKMNKAIEKFNTHKRAIFINGMLIFNSYNDTHKRELYHSVKSGIIYSWVDDNIVFFINFPLVRTIETTNETLYREDETLLW